MDDIIDKIYEQVMDEACANPLRRFAELVAAAEREACAEHYLGIMRDAVEQAVLRERELCAKICEDLFMADGDWCAKAIRERGEK